MSLRTQERLERWAQSKNRRSPKAMVIMALVGFVLASIIRAWWWYWGPRILLWVPNRLLVALGHKGFFARDEKSDEPELELSWRAFAKRTSGKTRQET